MSSSLELYLGQWVSRVPFHLFTSWSASRGLGEGVLATGTVEIAMGMLHLVVCVFLTYVFQAVVQSATEMYLVAAEVPSSGLCHCKR